MSGEEGKKNFEIDPYESTKKMMEERRLHTNAAIGLMLLSVLPAMDQGAITSVKKKLF